MGDSRIAAIDFETANTDRGSVCSVGVVIMEEGRTVKEIYHLVRPKDLWFDPYNVRVHGITKKDVQDKPEFNVIWEELRGELNDSFVIAHNASFDMSVLRHVMDDYAIEYPTFEYSCTCNIARKVWSGLPGYGLSYVADHLQISFAHHNALEDARACSEVARRAMMLHHVSSIHELTKRIKVGVGRICPGGYHPARASTEPRGGAFPASSGELSKIEPTTDKFDSEHPLFGRHIAFTGSLSSMERKEAVQFVVNCGAHFEPSVSKKTNFVVCGDQNLSHLKGKAKSSKIVKAEALIKQGQNLELISEREFLILLESDDANELSAKNEQIEATRAQLKKYRQDRKSNYSMAITIQFNPETGEVLVDRTTE
jgi:DNA polymerase-3 subunit epsilon